MTADSFAARLTELNLASKNGIADFVKKKTNFDDKLKNCNKSITLNKIKLVLLENELDELSEKVKLIPTKRLTKGLINNYSILNGGKHFGENGSQNYLVFQPFSRYFASKNGRIGLW